MKTKLKMHGNVEANAGNSNALKGKESRSVRRVILVTPTLEAAMVALSDKERLSVNSLIHKAMEDLTATKS